MNAPRPTESWPPRRVSSDPNWHPWEDSAWHFEPPATKPTPANVSSSTNQPRSALKQALRAIARALGWTLAAMATAAALGLTAGLLVGHTERAPSPAAPAATTPAEAKP